MLLPIKEILDGEVYRREEQKNNIIYSGKKKFLKNEEVVEIECILMKNTISGEIWIWDPSHKDLIADDYIKVSEKPIKKKEK